MKLLGAVMVMFGALCAGLGYMENRRETIQTLKELSELLKLVSSEMELNISPLPELICRLSEGTKGKVYGFLRELSASMSKLGEEAFSEIWTDCAQRSFSDRQTVQTLAELGRVLGRFGLAKQCEAIELCVDRLDTQAQKLRAGLEQSRRLALGLPVSVGALMVILLI